MSKVTELKDKFVEIYTENIKRPGSEKLLNYLLSESSDFFVAPASTRYHAKNEQGVWEKVPYYEFHETLPYGHGEKSVYIVSSYMRLTREEAMAIRWHMGFSGEENKNSIGLALEMYPLALATHITFYIEGGKA